MSAKKKPSTKKASAKKAAPDPAVAEESGQDKFRRMANKRVSKVLKQLQLIGNLAGSSYDYTEEQVELVRSAIQNSLDEAMKRFERSKKKEVTFEL